MTFLFFRIPSSQINTLPIEKLTSIEHRLWYARTSSDQWIKQEFPWKIRLILVLLIGKAKP